MQRPAAWLLCLILSPASGCALHVLAGADRNFQPDGDATGWHLGLGASLAFDPRQKGAVSVAASRRADSPGTSVESYRSDGYELRAELDLPFPGWRLGGAGRLADVEQSFLVDGGGDAGGGQVWGLSGGVTRYWPQLAQVFAFSVGPALSHWDASFGDVWSAGLEARFTWTFDGMLIVWAACDATCHAEVASFQPKGSSSGGHSWLSRPSRGTSCYYKDVTDSRGNPRSVWTCP